MSCLKFNPPPSPRSFASPLFVYLFMFICRSWKGLVLKINDYPLLFRGHPRHRVDGDYRKGLYTIEIRLWIQENKP